MALIYTCPHARTPASNYVMGSGNNVLLEDFNVDALDEIAYRRLKDTLGSYNLKVLEPIRLVGAVLDDVYLHKTFENDKLMMYFVNNIYFSDHDAVTVTKIQTK